MHTVASGKSHLTLSCFCPACDAQSRVEGERGAGTWRCLQERPAPLTIRSSRALRGGGGGCSGCEKHIDDLMTDEMCFSLSPAQPHTVSSNGKMGNDENMPWEFPRRSCPLSINMGTKLVTQKIEATESSPEGGVSREAEART